MTETDIVFNIVIPLILVCWAIMLAFTVWQIISAIFSSLPNIRKVLALAEQEQHRVAEAFYVPSSIQGNRSQRLRPDCASRSASSI